MIDELNKYKTSDHFFFDSGGSLGKVCNAPKNESGVYLIYTLAHGSVEFVYIGTSGKMVSTGETLQRKEGLYDRIVNGKQFGQKRTESWPKKLKEDEIDALDIYWFVTFDKKTQDIPSFVEATLLQKYYNIYGTLPPWNEEF